MIYSVLQQKNVPVTITKQIEPTYDEYGVVTNYTVHDASEEKIHVGYVSLQDTKNGVKVLYIKNQHPNLYKHFGNLADQIEVEHCIQRGIEKPYINSVAARGTYIKHFLRGKRFINEGLNIYLDYLTKHMENGKKIKTEFFGYQKMYMPINMINEIKEKIKLNPLLKYIK